MKAHDHHSWCDPDECLHDEDSEGKYASHYGRIFALAIDTGDTMPWRNEPAGMSEAQVRPIDFGGHLGVEVNMGDIRCTESTSGAIGMSWLTPAETRELGHQLIATARLVESGPVEMGEPEAWDVEADGTKHRWTNGDQHEIFGVSCDDGEMEVKPQVYERVGTGDTTSVRLPMVTVGDYVGLPTEQALALADELIRYATHIAGIEAIR